MHTEFRQTARKCPQAVDLAARGLRRVEKVKASGWARRELPDASQPEWAGKSEQAIIPGAAAFARSHLQPASRTGAEGLSVNLEPDKRPSRPGLRWRPDLERGEGYRLLGLVVKRRRAAARRPPASLSPSRRSG